MSLKLIYNGIKSYFDSQDTRQKLTVITSFASDSFKVIMASLLCVFVPQGCINETSNKDLISEFIDNKMIINSINGTTVNLKICTLTENFTNLIDFNVFVLAFNFFTLCYFIYLYIVELKRENWLIEHFDYDKEKSDNNILTLKNDYPDIIDKLQEYNYRYMKVYKYLQYIYIFNFLISAILVLYYYYYDYRTGTTLVTNTILCSNKIRIGKDISKQSWNNEFAYSFYNTKNISFNTIDRKYLTNNEDNLLEETNIDKKTENLSKHINSIKKYINTF
jgi:hypothetical protein